MTTTNPHRDPSEAVLAPLTFTSEDLQANRAGELTPSQRAMLEGYAHSSQRWGAISMVGLLVMTIVPAGYGIITASRAEDRWGWLIYVLFAGLISFFVWLSSSRANRRLPAAKLAVARGPAAKKIGDSDGSEYYTLHVGGAAFHLARAVFDAFTEGNAYCVYYVVHGSYPTILSFEPDEPADGTTAHAFRARYRA